MRRVLILVLTWVIFNFDLSAYNSLDYPWIEAQVWLKVEPYLLPETHPLKDKLDHIFGKKRITLSLEAIQKAGFKPIPMKNKRKVIAKHSELKGHLIKTYLDCHHLSSKDWRLWRHRAMGARQVQASIDKHQYDDFMKVPQKWLYPLPLGDLVNQETHQRRDFVLIVEDMQPLTRSKNKKMFRKMDQKQLDALYVILTENLLHDSIHIYNIPFCKDGKMAFLDLEHYNSHSRRIKFERLTPYFSADMQTFWQEITTLR